MTQSKRSRRPRPGGVDRHRDRVPEVARGACTSSTSSSASRRTTPTSQGGELEFPARLHVQGRAEVGADEMDDPVEMLLAEDGPARHHAGDRHGRRRTNGRARAASATPTASSRASASTRTRAWTRSARSTAYARRVRPQVRVGAFPAGPLPAGRAQRQEDVPDLREVHRARHPVLLDAGVPGPRIRFAPQDVALLDEVCWFFPELKFVTRHGGEPWTDARGEAAAQVAEPLLLDLRVRAEVLPEGHHRLREHARRRQDHLRRATSRWASTYDRIFAELPDVPFRDHVWPKFLLRERGPRPSSSDGCRD